MTDRRPDRVYGLLMREGGVFVLHTPLGPALPGGEFRPLAEDRKAELAAHIYDQLGVLISIRRVIEGQASLGELALYIDQELNHHQGVARQLPETRQWQIQQRLPFANSQRHVGFLAAYSNEASAAFNVVTAIRLAGELDAPALQAAIEETGNRIEALRTAIDPDSNALTVRAGEPLELTVTAFTADTLEQRLSEATVRAIEPGKRLFRVELFRVAEKDHLLALWNGCALTHACGPYA